VEPLREGTFTHATSSPVSELKSSISWESLVEPSEEVKRISSASAYDSLARSESEFSFTRTGKSVWVEGILLESIVIAFLLDHEALYHAPKIDWDSSNSKIKTKIFLFKKFHRTN